MADQKTIVISVRLTPAVHAALAVRAAMDRQPVTRMAALLVEDGLARKTVASVVPLTVPSLSNVRVHPEVQPFFRPEKRKGKRG